MSTPHPFETLSTLMLVRVLLASLGVDMAEMRESFPTLAAGITQADMHAQAQAAWRQLCARASAGNEEAQAVLHRAREEWPDIVGTWG
jgi:hypothetical protein